MKRCLAIQVRTRSWALAVVCLVTFCWLGFAAVRFGAIVQGLEVILPPTSRFAFAHGPIAFPLFGIVAAAALILSDILFRNRWLQWALSAVLALLIVWALKVLVIGGVFMGPATGANHFAAANSATMLVLQIGGSGA